MNFNDIDTEKGKVNIAEFSAADAALADLRERFKELPDANTTDGYALIKAGLKEVSGYRTKLESRRKEVKAPILEKGRVLDSEAKRITNELLKIETPLKDAKKAADDKEEIEKQKRIKKLQAKVDELLSWVTAMQGKTADEIGQAIQIVTDIDPTRDFYDLTNQAIEARDSVLNQLNDMLATRLEFERQEAENAALRIEQRISNLKMIPADMFGKTSKEILAKINSLETFQISPESFGNRTDEVISEKSDVISKLHSMMGQAKRLEAMEQVETEQPPEREPESTPKTSNRVSIGFSVSKKVQHEPDLLPQTDDMEETAINDPDSASRMALVELGLNHEQAFNVMQAIKAGKVPFVGFNPR
jgi:hypothetical protein